jgi:thioesterase domain-containing protein
MFSLIEKMLGRQVPLVSLFQAPTIAQLADLIRQEGGVSRWASLVPVRVTGGLPPFFLVASVDSTALTYQPLSRLLGAEQPFYVLQENADRTLHLEETATHYLREIRELQPQGPYYLGGHCSGGLVAFEIARQLRAQGEQTALLALIETYSPCKPNRLTLKFKLRRFAERTHGAPAGARLGSAALGAWRWFRQLMRETAFNSLWRLHLRSPHVLWRIDKNAFYRKVNELYRPEPYPGKIVLFRSEGHPYFVRDPLFWWEGLAAEIEVREIAGLHGTFLTESHIPVLAAQLAESLAGARDVVNDE